MPTPGKSADYFLFLLSKPFWLHFLMIPWECARRTLHPIMISLQERQNCQHQLLMKYMLDHFGSRPDKKYCGDDQDAFPLALVCFYDKTNTICTICLYTIIHEQRLSQWWLKLHGFGLYPQSWIQKRKSKKTDSWDEITGWTQLSFINNNQIIKTHEDGGFWTEVMGRRVCVKLWIHFIAGDTSGHNNLVGHMNGGWPKFIYQDCRCLFNDLSSPIPMCSLITSEEL